MDSLESTPHIHPKAGLLAPSIQYGIIIGLLSSLLFILTYLAKIPTDSKLSQLSGWIVAIVALTIVLRHFRDKRNHGLLSFGQGVGLSTLSGLWSGILYSAFFYVFMKFISPEFLESIQDKAISNMMDSGMKDEQIERSLKFAGIFMSPEFMSGMVILGSVLMYTILGLIITAILKKN